MRNEDNTDHSASEQDVMEIEEEPNRSGKKPNWEPHGKKVMVKATRGGNKGKQIPHFQCNYCPKKPFAGPSSSTFLRHLRERHPKSCPNLVSSAEERKEEKLMNTNFFGPKKKFFEVDIFMGHLLKWMVCTDQPFSMVDNSEFNSMMEYVKEDLSLQCRKTIMSRLDELYIQMKNKLKGRNCIGSRRENGT